MQGPIILMGLQQKDVITLTLHQRRKIKKEINYLSSSVLRSRHKDGITRARISLGELPEMRTEQGERERVVRP